MLMSSVLRLSMVSLIPLLTELLSSQLPRQNILSTRTSRCTSAGWGAHHPRGSCVTKPQTELFASDVTHLQGTTVLAVWTGSWVKAAMDLSQKAGCFPEQKGQSHCPLPAPSSTSSRELYESQRLLPRPCGGAGAVALETRTEGSA